MTSLAYLVFVIGQLVGPEAQHAVFDIDDVLLHDTSERTDQNIYYELQPGTADLLSWVTSHKGWRFSFYSAGPKERNQRFAKSILLRGNRTAFEIATSILSRNEIEDSVSGTPFKKDLSRVRDSSASITMIDNDPAWLLSEQISQLIWYPEFARALSPDEARYLSRRLELSPNIDAFRLAYIKGHLILRSHGYRPKPSRELMALSLGPTDSYHQESVTKVTGLSAFDIAAIFEVGLGRRDDCQTVISQLEN